MLAVPLKLRRAAPLNGLHQVPGTNAAFAGVPNGKCRSALRLGSDNHWKFLLPALSIRRISVLRVFPIVFVIVFVCVFVL